MRNIQSSGQCLYLSLLQWIQPDRIRGSQEPSGSLCWVTKAAEVSGCFTTNSHHLLHSESAQLFRGCR